MRALAILLAAVMLASPLAMAGDGDSASHSSSSSSSTSAGPEHPPSSSPSPTPPPKPPSQPPPQDGCPIPQRAPANETEKQACLERYCREHQDDERCAGRSGPGPANKTTPPAKPTGWERWCKDEARSDSQRQRCRQTLDEFRAGREGHWVTFRIDSANATLLGYAIGGLTLFESLHLETGSDNLTVARSGNALRLGDSDTELLLNDDPTGLVRFKGDDGSVTIRLAATAHVVRGMDDSVARIDLGQAFEGYLRADNATWLDNRTVVLSGFFAFLLDLPKPAEGRGDGLAQAIVDRKVGAEITVSAPAPDARIGTSGSLPDGTVKVLAYDDVEVQVRLPPSVATRDHPIRVELASDLTEGRTIVLNLNRSVLQSDDIRSLVLRYYDLHMQADGSTVETEVVFHQATDLRDILDPGNDGGQPEYWVVQDANGLQAMFTVPHWSAHAITIGSVASAFANAPPDVSAGILAGAAGSVLAAVALLWPRRRDD